MKEVNEEYRFNGQLNVETDTGAVINVNNRVRPYKVYTALLTQDDVDIPTAVVLENTVGVVSFTRAEAGSYTLVGTFPFGKTVVFFSKTLRDGEGVTDIVDMLFTPQQNSIQVFTLLNGTPFDGLLENTSVEIRVYP